MASPDQERQPAGIAQPPPPLDTQSLGEPSSQRAPPSVVQRREQSIRFSADSKSHSQSPMSNFRRSSDSDEITPIRGADGHADRRYNTDSTETAPASLDAPGGREQEEDDASRKKARGALFKGLARKYGAISLENKGSVARDHLALERTFLAWLRTSLAFASIGIAVTQLFRLNTSIANRSQPDPSSTIAAAAAHVPLSPLVGHDIPVDLLPFLQQIAASAPPSPPKPQVGPTLLDQLLLAPPAASHEHPSSWSATQEDLRRLEFDDQTAARLRHVGKPLGATFLAIAIVILFIGFHRYFESQHWIIRGKFPASRGSIFIVGFIAGSLIVASLAVVLAISPGSFEKKR